MNFEYKIIKNFLNKEELNLLQIYCKLKHAFNYTSFDNVQNNNGDTFFYSDLLMESLMVNKLDLMEKETGLKLFPTYTVWRMYSMFAKLDKHKDRASCEISVTVQISSNGSKWPIFMGGEEVLINDGDAIIYQGCKIEHWRNEFIGDHQAQAFLHYVNQEGPFKQAKYDARSFIGIEEKNRDFNLLQILQDIRTNIYGK
jgi:hypothetical protein